MFKAGAKRDRDQETTSTPSTPTNMESAFKVMHTRTQTPFIQLPSALFKPLNPAATSPTTTVRKPIPF